MNDKTLEEASEDNLNSKFPIKTMAARDWFLIKEGWNACLTSMTPIIEQRERERLQCERLIMALKRIEQFGHNAGHGCGYSCANIAKEALSGSITGNMEDGK